MQTLDMFMTFKQKGRIYIIFLDPIDSNKMLFYAIINTFSKAKVLKDESHWGDFGESQFSVKGLEDEDLESLDWN